MTSPPSRPDDVGEQEPAVVLQVPQRAGARQRDGLDRRQRRRLGHAAARGVDEDQRGQEAGDPGAEDVDRDAGDDVVDAEGDGRQRVQRPAERTADDAGQHPPPGPELEGPPGAEPGAEDELPLQADVDHAGALGPQAAEAGQPDRHGQPQRGAGGAAGGDVVGAGDQPDDRDQRQQRGDAEQDHRQRQPGRPRPVACGAIVLVDQTRAHGATSSARARPRLAAPRRPGAAAGPARSGGPARTRSRPRARRRPA